MNIVLISHPAFMNSQSMPRFARMLEQAYIKRGHNVQVWSPQPYFYKIFHNFNWSKWAGYLDQYLLFPIWLRMKIMRQPSNSLYVFCDQALGPWVPIVRNKPHIVHVHDLLALRSALGDIPENPTSWSGRIYQRYIRNGFQQSKHFISISNKTKVDLHHFAKLNAVSSEVVYNGLNYPYFPMMKNHAFEILAHAKLTTSNDGMLLHLGGSQWYKNLTGVIHLYIEYSKKCTKPLPLWCVSPNPGKEMQLLLKQVPNQGKVIFIQGIDNVTLNAAYSIARAFIFPSLAEGFGWPIIEAQACGCPVITTDAPPMNEIGGKAATYLPLLKKSDDIKKWAKFGADKIISLLEMSTIDRENLLEKSLANAGRFKADEAIDAYLNNYRYVLEEYEMNFNQKHKSTISRKVF